MDNNSSQSLAYVRNARTGKDGHLYNSKGALLATVDTFSSKISNTTTKYRPLGTFQELDVVTGFAVTLTFSQYIVEDDIMIREYLDFLKTGYLPDWSFQGVIMGSNGSLQRIIYRGCVPNGDVDLQNITIGEIIKRNWSFAVNECPDLQEQLKA